MHVILILKKKHKRAQKCKRIFNKQIGYFQILIYDMKKPHSTFNH